ncbi:hypothetical protein AKJ51_02405 [candidate division MSBL1 archaeon SCGC-AAA382A20]|uniref:Uncharacterized protein n=1 Tax=candidate division MSBL1 archaeon SCGC-AAA382A20 TaxID=1698280 RepID=A0A133VKK8_9EURY|nr:hypothetical protein AKJ51_02405 [candidate division MSBL1 archaeon SCGC-AAA382A20]
MDIEEDSEYGREIIMEVVDNQLSDGDPPETQKTLDRLLGEGYSEEKAKDLIGCVVVSEIFEIMNQGRRFDRQSYIEALENLPELPE